MSLQNNNNVIRNAFAKFTARKDQAITVGFSRMMEAGLEYLLEAHDIPIIPISGGKEIHHHNEGEKETLGWMIFHDGVEVASGTQNRGPLSGAILFEMESMGAGTTGWVGFVVSEMSFNWYRVDFEMDFLQYSADKIKENFNIYFRPIN